MFWTTPHSKKREFKDAKHIVLIVKLIANSASRKYKFAYILSPSHALCVVENPCDHKFRFVPITFGVILNSSSFLSQEFHIIEIVFIVTLRVSIPSLLTGALMYLNGHSSGLLKTKSPGRKFGMIYIFFAFIQLSHKWQKIRKKRLSNKLKPSTTATRRSQNQEIFKTQINV